jgi:hypothetical protein
MIVKYCALRREMRWDSLYTVVAAEYGGFTITNPHNPTDGGDDRICISFDSKAMPPGLLLVHKRFLVCVESLHSLSRVLGRAPSEVAMTRHSGGYNAVMSGVVMNVSIKASSMNVEKTLGDNMPVERPTLSTISLTRLGNMIEQTRTS